MLLAWYDLIDETACKPFDPGVARLKLDWWRTEIATLTSGTPRHPLALAMVAEGIDGRVIPQMLSIIDAAEQGILEPQAADDDAFADRCRAGKGNLFAAIAAAQSLTSDSHYACIEAGGYCAAVGHIQKTALAAHRLPIGVNVDNLRCLTVEQRAARLESLTDCFDRSAQIVHTLPGFARRMTVLATAIHDKMRRRDYPVLDELVDRPPIAHLWTAWRCR